MVARVTSMEAKVVGEVLQNYCAMSGQKVKLSKSHIIFSAGVSHQIEAK